jgi:hypothetical protein
VGAEASARVSLPHPRAPDGRYPKELGWAISGGVNGSTYRHDAILMVAGGAALSPHARGLDPYHLPRIQATEASSATGSATSTGGATSAM